MNGKWQRINEDWTKNERIMNGWTNNSTNDGTNELWKIERTNDETNEWRNGDFFILH